MESVAWCKGCRAVTLVREGASLLEIGARITLSGIRGVEQINSKVRICTRTREQRACQARCVSATTVHAAPTCPRSQRYEYNSGQIYHATFANLPEHGLAVDYSISPGPISGSTDDTTRRGQFKVRVSKPRCFRKDLGEPANI